MQRHALIVHHSGNGNLISTTTFRNRMQFAFSWECSCSRFVPAPSPPECLEQVCVCVCMCAYAANVREEAKTNFSNIRGPSTLTCWDRALGHVEWHSFCVWRSGSVICVGQTFSTCSRLQVSVARGKMVLHTDNLTVRILVVCFLILHSSLTPLWALGTAP